MPQLPAPLQLAPRGRRNGLRIGLALIGALILLAGALSREIHLLTSATQPEHGFLARGERKALVIVDVQEDYTGATARGRFPYRNSLQLVERLNGLAARARAAGWEVVYVRQVFRRPLSVLVSRLFLGGTALAGPGAEFDGRLRFESANRFEKPFSDAFSSTSFESFVRNREIRELYLAGLDGAGCVDVTARGARNRGLSALILEDVVASQSDEDFRRLKAQYPAIGIRVLSSSELQLDPAPSHQP